MSVENAYFFVENIIRFGGKMTYSNLMSGIRTLKSFLASHKVFCSKLGWDENDRDVLTQKGNNDRNKSIKS